MTRRPTTLFIAILVLALGVLTHGSAQANGGTATIRGTVVDGLSDPVQTCVTVYPIASQDEAGSACTDDFGEYFVGDLPAGTYEVLYDPITDDLARQWWNGASRRSGADPITLVSGDEAVADATLVSGGTVAGLVTDEQGDPVVGAKVRAYEIEGVYSRSAVTDGTGAYTIAGLDDEDYRLEVVPGSSRLDLLGEWYDDKTDYAGATAVPVPNGANVTANVELEEGATISGVVTGENGPIAGIAVAVFDSGGNRLLTVWTGPQGEYTSTALPPGDYKVAFWPNYYGGQEYANEWWDNKGSFATADIISLGPKQKRTGVNARLDLLVPNPPPVTGPTNPPPVQNPPPPVQTPLTAPTKVKVTVKKRKARVTWKPVTDAQAYQVRVSPAKGKRAAWKQVSKPSYTSGKLKAGKVRRGGQSPGRRRHLEPGDHAEIQGEVDDPHKPAQHHHHRARRHDVGHRTRGRVPTDHDSRAGRSRVRARRQAGFHRGLPQGDGIAQRDQGARAHHQAGEEARKNCPDSAHFRGTDRPEARQVRAGHPVPHTQGRDLPAGQAVRALPCALQEDHRTDCRLPHRIGHADRHCHGTADRSAGAHPDHRRRCR